MKTNELKKGDYVKLRNGWLARMADNQRGTIRMAEVYGTFVETGSVYSHDILLHIAPLPPDEEPAPRVQYIIGGMMCPGNPPPEVTMWEIVAEIEHTDAQNQLALQVAEF